MIQSLKQRIINRLIKYFPSIIFITGLVLTFSTAVYVNTSSQKKEETDFNLATEQVEAKIKDSTAFYNSILFSTRALFYTKSSITQFEFQKFISNLYLEKEYPGIDTIGYIISFPSSQKEEILNQLRNSGLTNYAFHPPSNHPVQSAILYAEPPDLRNQALVGLNLSSIDQHRITLERSRDLGQITSTGKVSLEQTTEKVNDSGFFAYLPIYNTETIPTSPEEKIKQLKGYVFTVFNADEYLDRIFKNSEADQINFSIYDGDSLEDAQLLYSNNTDKQYQPSLQLTRKVEILGHHWTIQFSNKPSTEINSLRRSVPTIIIVGLILTLIIFITTESQIRARFAAESTQQQLLEAQSEVKASEERLRLVIQDSREYVIILLNRNGRVISWNLGAENVLGFTEPEIVNKYYAVFFTDKERKNNIPKKDLIHALKNGSTNFERLFVKKNGDKFWVSGVVNAVYDQNHKLKGFTLIARDVSIRKQIEADLIRSQKLTQAILNSLNIYIAVLDKFGTVIAVNTAWEKMKIADLIDNPFKFTIGNNYILDFEKIIRPTSEFIRQGWRGIQKVLNGSLPQFNLEIPLQRKTNEDEDWFVLQVNPLVHDDGGVVVSYVNITDRKKLERQKDEFLRIASHELKTPITSIKAYAQVLLKILRHKADDNTTKALVKMDQQINKVTKLVNDLLDVSKVEAGLLKFNFQNFNFDNLIREVVETIQLTSEDHRIIIQGSTQKEILSDPERISQVVTNLLNNAVKYSPESQKVLVKLSAPNDQILVEITDVGPGISEADQEHLFERFYRVSSQEFQGYPGMGLGLYISAEIIHRLGGRIGVISKLGKGSTFYFALPINNQ